MKILVAISNVPDTTTKIAFTDNDTKFSEDKVQYIVNPYDEWYALVRALEIKETSGGNVTIITVGPASVDADPTVNVNVTVIYFVSFYKYLFILLILFLTNTYV
jgi:electron transfer flavoprotein beta subunit